MTSSLQLAECRSRGWSTPASRCQPTPRAHLEHRSERKGKSCLSPTILFAWDSGFLRFVPFHGLTAKLVRFEELKAKWVFPPECVLCLGSCFLRRACRKGRGITFQSRRLADRTPQVAEVIGRGGSC